MRTTASGWISVVLFVAFASAAAAHRDGDTADRFPSDVATVWFDLLYDVVRSEGTPPPQASRIFGITSTALYESIVAGTAANESLVGQLNDLRDLPQAHPAGAYHWPSVGNATLAQSIRGIFTSLKPESLAAVDALEARFSAKFRGEVRRRDFHRSVAFGKSVADAVLAWAATDGFASLNNCPYVPQPADGAWEPTPPANNPNPLQPCWGQIRPMVLTTGEDCAPPGHPGFSTDADSPFHTAALEVYNVGANLTDEQRTIATYWADGPGTGTPPGHWIALVGQLARADALSLAAAAEAYVRVGIAVHDAFIECWHFKYVTSLQRPVTYIRQNIDAGWSPLIPTPGFPTYASGHSTQSGAAAEVLTDLFGVRPFTDTIRTDHDLGPPEAPRSFLSFDHAAYEAAMSRLYGGIHYGFDNNDGLLAGRCIGHTILDRVTFREPRRHHDDEQD
jgi:hypothetical protein